MTTPLKTAIQGNIFAMVVPIADMAKPVNPKIATKPPVTNRSINASTESFFTEIDRLVVELLELPPELMEILLAILSKKYDMYDGSIANPHGFKNAIAPALNANPTRMVSNVNINNICG